MLNHNALWEVECSFLFKGLAMTDAQMWKPENKKKNLY